MYEDLHYIELDYVESSYFTYTANALCDVQVNSTVTCTAEVVAGEYFVYDYIESGYILPSDATQAEAQLVSAFSVTATPGLLVELDQTNWNSNITVGVEAIVHVGEYFVYDYIDSNYFVQTPGQIQEGSAELVAQANLTATVERIIVADSELNGAFAQTVDADRVRFADTSMDSAFDQSTTADRIRFADSAQSSEFTQTTTGDRIRFADSAQSSEFAQTTTADRIRSTAINVDSEFEQITTGNRVRFAVTSMDSAFDQSTTADRVRFADSAQSSEFAQITTADRIRDLASEQTTDAQLTAQGGFVQSADVTMTGAFSPTIKVDITLRGQVYMEFAAAMTVDAVRIKDSAVDPIESQATVTAQGMAVRISYSVYVRDSQPDPSPENNNAFGAAVAIDSNNTWWATAPGEGDNQGIAYQFRPTATFNNPDPQTFSEFGSHAITYNNNSVFVNYGGLRTNRVYQFSRSTGAVTRTYTTNSTTDQFGRALSATSTRLAVGAPQAGGRGLVYVYNLVNNTFIGTINREIDPLITASQFGASVAITGNLLLIGAPNYNSGAGSLFVYDLTTLEFVRQINNPNPFDQGFSDQFAARISAWNNLVVVSSAAESTPAVSDTNSGIAYVFDVNTGDLIHTIANPNLFSNYTGDVFSTDVAINESYIAVTAPGEDTPETAAGVIYLFSTQTGQLLTHIQNPNAFGTAESDQFATRIALNENNWLIAGVRFEDSATATNTGHVYVFEIVVEASEPVDVVVETQIFANLTRAPYEFESYQTIEASIQATAIKTAVAQSDQITAAQIAATVLRIQQLAAELNTTSELDSITGAIRPAESDLATDATVYAFADKIKTNASDMIVTVEVDATATQIFGFAADWSTATTITALGGIRYSLSAAGFAQTSVLATGRIIDLNKEVWRITKENRTFAIQTETRDYTIAREQRVWSIT